MLGIPLVRETQVETTISCLSERPVSKRKDTTKVGKNAEEAASPGALLAGRKLAQPLRQTVRKFLKNLKTEPLYDSAVPLQDIYPDKAKPSNLKRKLHPHVHCSIVYDSQDTETTRVSIRACVSREEVVQNLHTQRSSIHRKKE